MNKLDKKRQFQDHLMRIRETFEKDLEALYRLYPEFVPATSVRPGQDVSRGKLVHVIRQALNNRPNVQFRLNDVRIWLQETDPNQTATFTNSDISNVLFRLAKRKEIEAISPPKTRPVLYRTISRSQGGVHAVKIM
ncbi:MAG: hypothetical protein QME66_05935 [Candidatus Eisenbacteria bacterium]|nr:hypothetical protein [Candidatus Eisenbacteria bacterium]